MNSKKIVKPVVKGVVEPMAKIPNSINNGDVHNTVNDFLYSSTPKQEQNRTNSR